MSARTRSVLAPGTRDASLCDHAGAIVVASRALTGGREALALTPAFVYTGVREGRALLAAAPGGP